ncbi:hypothetical protein BDZ89DRAFT_1155509 [Hymenopellis radicata]|nr:hypothetical protein BDZ89DRAFT_1155509 [Hymenopellis radicata]
MSRHTRVYYLEDRGEREMLGQDSSLASTSKPLSSQPVTPRNHTRPSLPRVNIGDEKGLPPKPDDAKQTLKHKTGSGGSLRDSYTMAAGHLDPISQSSDSHRRLAHAQPMLGSPFAPTVGASLSRSPGVRGNPPPSIGEDNADAPVIRRNDDIQLVFYSNNFPDGLNLTLALGDFMRCKKDLDKMLSELDPSLRRRLKRGIHKIFHGMTKATIPA